MAAIVCAYLTFYFGLVMGEEFSPDDFQRRTFSYYQLPLLNIQISPIDRHVKADPVGAYLVGHKLIKEISTTDEKRRWDLVVAKRGLPTNQKILSQGDARVLCSYFDEKRNSEPVWLEWSKKNRALSKILWPVVAKLARQELYIFIPEVLVAARGAKDPEEFQKALDATLAEQYLALAKAQRQLGQHEHALELIEEALHHNPDLAEAVSEQANTQAQLRTKNH